MRKAFAYEPLLKAGISVGGVALCAVNQVCVLFAHLLQSEN